MLSLAEWWHNCHTTDDSFYVSDYGGSSLWQPMNIIDRVRPGRTVLEIGVGTGKNIRALQEAGARVHALDIVPSALAKVRDHTERQWLESQMEQLPSGYFDLAISHLVTQHISNAALERQLTYVVRSLKRRGIFAMQFADRMEGMTDEAFDESRSLQEVGGVCRSVSMMTRLVRSCGGKVVWVSDPVNFTEYGSRWFYLHIARPWFTSRVCYPGNRVS